MTKKAKDTREAPISFRPGRLRSLLQQRALRTLTEGQIVKRDLGRYYQLIGEALAGVRLTRSEATYLAQIEFEQQLHDSFSGDPFIPEHENPSNYLLRVVKKPVRASERSGTPASEIEYRVADKVEKMSPIERAALVDAIDRLPSQTEEEVGDVGHWYLIGVPLTEDVLTVNDITGSEPA